MDEPLTADEWRELLALVGRAVGEPEAEVRRKFDEFVDRIKDEAYERGWDNALSAAQDNA